MCVFVATLTCFTGTYPQVMHGLCLQHLLLDGDEGGSGGDGMKGCDDTEL